MNAKSESNVIGRYELGSSTFKFESGLGIKVIMQDFSWSSVYDYLSISLYISAILVYYFSGRFFRILPVIWSNEGAFLLLNSFTHSLTHPGVILATVGS